MSAKKSKGGATNQRNKDVAMAARMKAEGIERRTTACPICHRIIGLTSLYGHLGKCNA